MDYLSSGEKLKPTGDGFRPTGFDDKAWRFGNAQQGTLREGMEGEGGGGERECRLGMYTVRCHPEDATLVRLDRTLLPCLPASTSSRRRSRERKCKIDCRLSSMSLEILQEERYSPALVGKEIQRLDSPTISGTVITVLGTLTYFGIARQKGTDMHKIKIADWVCCQSDPNYIGCVKRIDRDGSWVDVDWRTHTKRMRKPEILQIVTTLNLGNGVEITDMTREVELKTDILKRLPTETACAICGQPAYWSSNDTAVCLQEMLTMSSMNSDNEDYFLKAINELSKKKGTENGKAV